MYMKNCASNKLGNFEINEGFSWPVTSYNFSRWDEFSIKDQIDLIHNSGYNGIILKSASKEDF